MNYQVKKLLLGLGLLCATQSAFAQWRTLDVALTTQEHSEWCWAASSKAVIGYFEAPPNQCDVANWAYGINYACGSSNFYWNSYANQPNTLFGNSGSVQDILSNWGIWTYAVNDYLSWAHIVQDIDANRPFIMRYGWTYGGGHVLVGRGYEVDSDGSRYLYLMNPWPGEGMTYASYDYAVYANDHTWTHSLRTNY
ncbi:MAG: C39 family peptidase [Burkholderiales bacterium]|nr:C39 family peptidase [Burkholderiales bacterium]